MNLFHALHTYDDREDKESLKVVPELCKENFKVHSDFTWIYENIYESFPYEASDFKCNTRSVRVRLSPLHMEGILEYTEVSHYPELVGKQLFTKSAAKREIEKYNIEHGTCFDLPVDDIEIRKIIFTMPGNSFKEKYQHFLKEYKMDFTGYAYGDGREIRAVQTDSASSLMLQSRSWMNMQKDELELREDFSCPQFAAVRLINRK